MYIFGTSHLEALSIVNYFWLSWGKHAKVVQKTVKAKVIQEKSVRYSVQKLSEFVNLSKVSTEKSLFFLGVG